MRRSPTVWTSLFGLVTLRRSPTVWTSLFGFVATALASSLVYAQQPAAIPLGIGQRQGPAQGNQRGGQQNQGLGGGSAQADFDSLIDLIQSTVSADTWIENGTGEGEMQPFPNGIYADAKGTLRFAEARAVTVAPEPIRNRAARHVAGNARQRSSLRYISLPRLERAIRARQLRHEALPESMLTLAGLERVQYVFVLPPGSDAVGAMAADNTTIGNTTVGNTTAEETTAENTAVGSPTVGEPGDLILAGPAADWQVQPDGKIVSVRSGQPVVRLDDLLTLWRRHRQRGGAPFGVSINPRQQGLARVQSYLRATGGKPIEPGERGDWLRGLQDSLGRQDVEFFGIDADSHVAQVLLVADYHMKLIGMGLADGVEGVSSYLDRVEVGPNGSLPPMTVLRWWFAMQYEPVTHSPERNVFQLHGLGAKVLSENELLAARGQRLHTGKSEDLNRQYATSFSEQFEPICQKYPLYTELRNVFDLSMVLALVQHEHLIERAAWQPTLFANADWLPLPQTDVPVEVETVVSHRVIRRKHIVAGVSGGVWIDPREALAIEADSHRLAKAKIAPTTATDEIVWWWD